MEKVDEKNIEDEKEIEKEIKEKIEENKNEEVEKEENKEVIVEEIKNEKIEDSMSGKVDTEDFPDDGYALEDKGIDDLYLSEINESEDVKENDNKDDDISISEEVESVIEDIEEEVVEVGIKPKKLITILLGSFFTIVRTLIFVAALGILALFFLKDMVIKSYLTSTNIADSIGKLSFNPFSNTIVLEDIVIKKESSESIKEYKIDKITLSVKEYSIKDKKIDFSSGKITGFDFNHTFKESNKGISNSTKIKNSALESLNKEIEASYLENEKKLGKRLIDNYTLEKNRLDSRLKPLYLKLRAIDRMIEAEKKVVEVKTLREMRTVGDIFSGEVNLKELKGRPSMRTGSEEAERKNVIEKIEVIKSDPTLFTRFYTSEGIDFQLKIDEKNIEKLIEEELNELLEEKIHEKVLIYGELYDEITSRVTKEMDTKLALAQIAAGKRIDKNFTLPSEESEIRWILNFSNLVLETEEFGLQFRGEIPYFSNQLHTLTTPMKFDLLDISETNRFQSDVRVRDLSGSLRIDIKELNPFLTSSANKLINRGKLRWIQNSNFSKKSVSLSGDIVGRAMSLNSKEIVNSFMEDYTGGNKEGIRILLGAVLDEIKTIDLAYFYDSSTRRLVIRSGLSDLIKRVLKQNGKRIALAIYEERLLNFSRNEIEKYRESIKNIDYNIKVVED